MLGFYQKASLLLNLSRIDECTETFGLTIIEAMAFGIPSIVPPVGGPAELVSDDKEGFLISSYETDLIVNRIRFIQSNKSEYRRLSCNARRRAYDFREELFNQQIIDFVNE